MRSFHRSYRSLAIRFLCGAAATLGLLAQSGGGSFAQATGTRWKQPIVLFDAGEAAQVFNPIVFEDTEGSVKILWEVYTGAATDSGDLVNGIYCLTGDGNTWSSPVDVIAPPDGGRAFWPRHTVDAVGRVHLVWVGPNAKLFYSRAASAQACDARSWVTETVPITDQVLYGDIVADNEGVLHIAYAASGKDVYYTSSADNGHSWSDPVAVSRVQSTVATAVPAIAVEANGRIHIAWEEDQLPNGMPSLGLHYAWSDDSGNTWSLPIQFSQAEGAYTEPALAVLQDGSVHLLWNGRISTRGRYHRWSVDSGQSWTNPVEFVAKELGGGQTGKPGFDIDGAGTLHVVTGTDETTYTALIGRAWAPPRELASFAEFGNMEHQAIAVVGGNRLYVVANAGLTKLVLISGASDAPAATTTYKTPPTETALELRTAAPPIVTPTVVTPTATVLPPAPAAAQREADSIPALLLSSGLALLVVAAAVAINLGRRR